MSYYCNIFFKSDIGDAISMDELGIAYIKLYDARSKWFDIGLALKISYSTLELIESEKTNHSERLRMMLVHRIQSGGPLTWDDLSSSLRYLTVGRNDLANEIDQERLKLSQGRLNLSIKLLLTSCNILLLLNTRMCSKGYSSRLVCLSFVLSFCLLVCLGARSAFMDSLHMTQEKLWLSYTPMPEVLSELRLATDSQPSRVQVEIETGHFFVLLSQNSVVLPCYLSCFSETPLVGGANSSAC